MKETKIAPSAIWKMVKNPALIFKMLTRENFWRYRATKKYGHKTGLPMLELADFLQDHSETISPIAFLGGGSMPTDLALIKALLRKYPVENYLEIGTWRGESVANAASLVKRAYTVNLPDETILTWQSGHEYVGTLRQFSENLPNVVHIQANSTTFDFCTLGVRFGLVFIDGDHTYHAVKADTRNILKVLEPDGIIVWHDYTRHVDQIRWSVLNGILDGMPIELHDRLFGVSHSLCAVFLPRSLGEFSPTDLSPYRRLKQYFSVNIHIKSNG